jgi:ubiquinone/menaquinone biosynthesis C-methylase UbiE
MDIKGPSKQDSRDEISVIAELLDLRDARVLELGCGGAEKTRQIAENLGVAEIIAAEVDTIQHEKNLKITDLPQVTFKHFGAEAIEAGDNVFDVVLMFKSLHHVPGNLMATALGEIKRVLKPNGRAYISEPVFDGEFNDIMRLFHDEQQVRQQAFDALSNAVNDGLFELDQEYFFKNTVRMQSFEQYEKGILGATHTDHNLSTEVYDEVKRRFMACESKHGFVFDIPNRVDVLCKPG